MGYGEAVVTEKSYWLHEDDHMQIEFLPIECWDYCRAEFAKIDEHEKAHRAPDGIGWTKMYFRGPSPYRIANLGIPLEAIKILMPWRLRRIDRVLTGGWSGDGVQMERMAAYKVGSGAILVGWDEADMVDTLWFHGFAKTWWDRTALTEAFARLGSLCPMLLVDWNGVLVDLRDVNAIRNYLADRPQEPAPAPNDGAEQGALLLHRFEQPVRPAIVVRKTAGGPSGALLAGEDGRCWRVTFDDPGLQAAPDITPVKFEMRKDDRTIDCCDLAGDRLLIFRDRDGRDWYEVHDIRTDDPLFTTPADEGAVLTPDGRYLLVCRSEGLALADLDQPEAPMIQTGLFATIPDENDAAADTAAPASITFDNAQSAMTASTDVGAAAFTLAVGDYGFVIVAELRIDAGREDPITVTSPPRTFSEGLVYDPVDIVDITPGRWVIVRHGHGIGLSGFDLETGNTTDCMPPRYPIRRYGCFRHVVVSSSSPALVVRTDRGPYYWNGNEPPRRLDGFDRDILVMTDECYVGLTPDGFELVQDRFERSATSRFRTIS